MKKVLLLELVRLGLGLQSPLLPPLPHGERLRDLRGLYHTGILHVWHCFERVSGENTSAHTHSHGRARKTDRPTLTDPAQSADELN